MRMKTLGLILVLAGLLGCQDVSIGRDGAELITSDAWGRPKDILKVESYELWLYEFSNIDSIIFLKNSRVIGQIKASVQEKVWSIAQTWTQHANRSEAYRLSLDKHVQDMLQHNLRIGMTPEEVRLAWGYPKEMRTYDSKYGIRQKWIYQSGAYETTELVFTNRVLTDIKNR